MAKALSPPHAPHILGLALLASVSPPALAEGTTATSTGAASAETVAPVSAVNLRDLDFGTIIASGTSGAINVQPDGTVTYSGGIAPACPGSACASGHPAAFSVAGEPGSSFSVSLPAQVVAYGSGADGSLLPPLVVDAIVARSATTGATGTTGRLDADGKDRIDVGGRLRIPSTVNAGHYRAMLTLAVNYL